jgi:hypothetical protein
MEEKWRLIRGKYNTEVLRGRATTTVEYILRCYFSFDTGTAYVEITQFEKISLFKLSGNGLCQNMTTLF